jgi:hypothetical protein
MMLSDDVRFAMYDLSFLIFDCLIFDCLIFDCLIFDCLILDLARTVRPSARRSLAGSVSAAGWLSRPVG